MHAKNLAIVWAPNLLSPRNPDYGNSALLEINVQAILVEFLIRNTEELFDVNAASMAIVANPQYNTMQERGPHHGLKIDTGKPQMKFDDEMTMMKTIMTIMRTMMMAMMT